MLTLVLVRHGESVMNKENRFCGWIDVDLSPNGELEAISAAESLKSAGIQFGHVFTSVLKRAIQTSKFILEKIGQADLPSTSSWRLNERHYGSLQGLNKAEVAEKYGEEQVKLWRRSYDIPPPPCDVTSEYFPGNDLRYSEIPADEIPNGESLKLTQKRVLPFWNERIVPELKHGAPVLVVAHGNSLRSLIQYLEALTEEEILEFNLPTAVPVVYELDESLKVCSKRYLMNEEELKAKMASTSSVSNKKN
ncbi:phosphoglycerate mutase, putative [Theileria equi strain WA]|uniref:Phosphoglycerate mutase n=1 Tax=Theileria equi strain WA TaxID=1537102 RepID=L0B2T6_THEEQ|nr:phosphoglycerate mutase, putative [Theileria equi strain WA]AFZ81536.1 phosphoglycerate mutase, putative [Theileria equi strain WA]|eukprot:XP_004831202.1 phosphoglycerate mutase, putative [Theileria equi strain WA]